MKENVKVLSKSVVTNANVGGAYDLVVGAELTTNIECGVLKNRVYMSAIFSSEAPDILEIRISEKPIVCDIVRMHGDIEQLDKACFSITDSRHAYRTQYRPQIELLMKLVKDKLVQLNYYKRGWKTQWIK